MTGSLICPHQALKGRQIQITQRVTHLLYSTTIPTSTRRSHTKRGSGSQAFSFPGDVSLSSAAMTTMAHPSPDQWTTLNGGQALLKDVNTQEHTQISWVMTFSSLSSFTGSSNTLSPPACSCFLCGRSHIPYSHCRSVLRHTQNPPFLNPKR